MVKRSRGRMSHKTRSLGRSSTAKKVTVSERIRTIEVGTKVQLVPNSKFEDFPAPRYGGRVGTVVGKQGNAYVVDLMDGSVRKRLITTAVHLKSC